MYRVSVLLEVSKKSGIIKIEKFSRGREAQSAERPLKGPASLVQL